jgi:DNA-directed RNA polymerase specialized sigma24 family protein
MAKLLFSFVLVVLLVGCEIARSDQAPAGSSEKDAPLALGGPDDAGIPSCLLLLAPHEAAVKSSIRSRYRLSSDDSHDLVRDAMLRVCIRNVNIPVRRPGAALQVAAENAAKDGWRQRRRYGRCPIDEAMPACPVASEPLARFEQELELVEAALCKEDRATERIIRLRAQEDLTFNEIGRQLGLTTDEARTRFHNGIRRVTKRAREQCAR